MIIERTEYFAKPGLAGEVLATRRRACAVRREIGLAAGQVFVRREGGDADAPDVVWECSFANEEEQTSDLAARAASPAFSEVRAVMTLKLERFVRQVLESDSAPLEYEDTAMHVTKSFDVVVVGFGFAGGIAAIEAHDAGARVLLLEKQPDPGGISVCSAGGLRITHDADAAFAYLVATNAGTAPEPLLRVLAHGMLDLPDYARTLADAVGACVDVRAAAANYPFPGYDSFGFAFVEEFPAFDPATEFSSVRGSPAGARLFKVVLENVRRRPNIEVRLDYPVQRLILSDGEVRGVVAAGRRIEARSVVLACGGFEAAEDLQRNWWSIKPVLSAAVRGNTGDGIRLAQTAGADIWHTWHFHGSYGFRHPEPDYPFGVRLKRLPDWIPGQELREDVKMSWILVDRAGRRFVNEYEPYMQDTGHRALDTLDPVTQSHPRIPAIMLLDKAGLDLYPLSAPTWNDQTVAKRYGDINLRELDRRILTAAETLGEMAGTFGIEESTLSETVARWNACCRRGTSDDFGRPSSSMMPIETPPFFAAHVWPIVSNTQGGPVHDERQRVLDAFGAALPGLYAAGELGSVFGHLYMSGGNIAECFVGGRIAGRNAAEFAGQGSQAASRYAETAASSG